MICKMTQKDSLFISNIRFPLAVMVVAIHASLSINGWSYAAIGKQGLGSDIAQISINSIANVLAHVAVPLFFVISGFLFFSGISDGSLGVWKRKLCSRCKTLVLPYLLWHILSLFIMMVSEIGEVAEYGLFGWFEQHGGLKMLWCYHYWNLERVDIWGNPAISSAPILTPMWFIRDLIVCILLSPVFFLFFRKSNNKLRIIGTLVLSSLYFSQTSLFVPGLNATSLFYFGLGAFLSLGDYSLTTVFKKYKILLICAFVSLFLIEVILDGHNTQWGNIIYPFYVFVGVIAFLNMNITGGGNFQDSPSSYLPFTPSFIQL